MRKLIYQSLVTLDGFIGGPNGELDWHLVTPELHEVFNAAQRAIGGYVMGRKTYAIMRGWDELGGKPDDAPEYRGFHDRWIELPKLVFSRTQAAVGRNATHASGPPNEAVGRLKSGDGLPIAVAGGEMAAAVADLIDEYLLFIHPVLLGSGTRFFQDRARRSLTLLETRTHPAGIVELRYAAG